MPKRKRDRKGRFVKKASRRRARSRSRAPAKRRRTTTSRRRAPAKRRRRRTYRRNPKFKPVDVLMEGAQGAVAVTLGKAGARAVPQMVGLPTVGMMGIAAQAAVALGLAMVAGKVSPRWATFVAAGALSGPIESIIRDLQVPVLSPALAAYPGMPMLPTGDSYIPDYDGGGSNGLASYAGAGF